jgi:hypothetical protein
MKDEGQGAAILAELTTISRLLAGILAALTPPAQEDPEEVARKRDEWLRSQKDRPVIRTGVMSTGGQTVPDGR